MLMIIVERVILRFHGTPITENKDPVGIVPVLADAVEPLRLGPAARGVLGRHPLEGLCPLPLHAERA